MWWPWTPIGRRSSSAASPRATSRSSRRSPTPLRDCAAAGVERGWRIPLVDDASVLAVAALIGATRVGASTALMNPRLTGGELAVLMHAAGTATAGVVGAAY